jgi:hypothetical protein
MGEHKNKAGVPVPNDRYNSEPRTRQTWSMMNNATKLLFISVLVVMAGALLSMVPGWRVPGYIVCAVGLVVYFILELMPVWRTWRSSRHLPGAQ